MPSTIYLRSGDEFTVTQPYALALERWTTRSSASWVTEFTVIWWRDPKYLDDDDDRATYGEQPATIDLDTIVAVERLGGPVAESLERARKAQADRADQS